MFALGTLLAPEQTSTFISIDLLFIRGLLSREYELRIFYASCGGKVDCRNIVTFKHKDARFKALELEPIKIN